MVARPRQVGRSSFSGRTSALCLAGLVVAAVTGLGEGHAGAAAPRYNVLLISMDSVRRDALGCYGRRPRRAADRSTTPSLDALAAQGVRMTEAYASTSWTLPSHLSMLTGQPTMVHGVESDLQILPASEPTLAEVLAQHGYQTVGIYSGPYLDPHWGLGRGFNRYQAAYGGALVKAMERVGRGGATMNDDIDALAQHDVTSEQVTQATVAELDRLAASPQPWFLFAHYFDAHYDYVPPPPYDRMFDPDYAGTINGVNYLSNPRVAVPDPQQPERWMRQASDRDLDHLIALYEGEVSWVDAHIGTVLRHLDEKGLAKDTLVVVVSDHGDEFFEHQGIGHRRTLDEEVTGIPLLLRLPGVLPAGATTRGLVSIADLFPTVLDILALPIPTGRASQSFLPLIRGAADPARRSLLMRLVRLRGGTVTIDSQTSVPVQQVSVQEVFRTGPIKITRRREWPQFPSGLRADVAATLREESTRQYGRETLEWEDVERFADQPPERRSRDFTEAAPRTALASFREQYRELLRLRGKPTSTPVSDNVRHALEQLGYGQANDPVAPVSTDFVLPLPGDGADRPR